MIGFGGLSAIGSDVLTSDSLYGSVGLGNGCGTGWAETV